MAAVSGKHPTQLRSTPEQFEVPVRKDRTAMNLPIVTVSSRCDVNAASPQVLPVAS